MAADEPSDDFVPISGNGMSNPTGFPLSLLEHSEFVAGDSDFLRLAVLQYLFEHGMHESVAAYERESGLVFDEQLLDRQALVTMERHYVQLTREVGAPASLDGLDDPMFDVVLKAGPCVEASTVLTGLHPMNITGVQFAKCGEPDVLYTACSDRTVRAVSITTGAVISEAKGHFGSAVACLAASPVTPGLVLCGAMDGGHALVDMTVADAPLVQRFACHSKAVSRVSWAPHGNLFATASYDHSARLFRPSPTSDTQWLPGPIMDFAANVEAIAFTADGLSLICAPREDNFLYIVDLETQQRRRLNMNAGGDTWVTFSALDLALSPSGQYLLANTDKSRALLFDLRRDGPIKTYLGMANEGFSQPRSCFDATGQHVYSTSQDYKVHVLETSTERLVGTLTGHTKTVRDLDLSARLGVLATGSYDKSVRLWKEAQ